MTVEWRPERNALTTPPSTRARVIPKDSIGYTGLSERIVQKNPVCSAEQAEAVLRSKDEVIQELLLDGYQVTLENAFTYHISITGRMDASDDPLPPDSMVNVQVHASRPFVEKVRQKAVLERLAPEKKVPLIAGAKDTMLDLHDVLNPDGVLRLSGTDLDFDPKAGTGECVLEGTRNGRAVQTRFAMISNALILVVPVIPAQPDPWNNEYRVSVSTRYTARGSLRTGTYERLLRTPLAVTVGNDNGILSGAEANPLVRVTGGEVNAESVQVRIQAALNSLDGELYFNLLDMNERGTAGDAVRIPDNGVYTLPGFAGSDLAALEVSVDRYAILHTKIREEYTGRMADILEVSSGE